MGKLRGFILKNKIDCIFLLNAIVFGYIFKFARIVGDDAVHITAIGDATVLEQIKYNLDMYTTWTSRVLLNSVWTVALGHGCVAFAVFMGFCAFVMTEGLFQLFGRKDSVTDALFVIFAMMLFPFRILTSAGWVAATGTDFATGAMMVYGLVPIKRFYNGESIKIWEFPLFVIALIWAGNFEQSCITLLLLYGVWFVYGFIAKKVRWEAFAFLGVNIASLVFILTCPGNWIRKQEEAKLFPTYKMMGFLDKTELATSLTLKWIFVDSIPIIVFAMGLIAFIAVKKYKTSAMSFVAAFPFVIAALLGPLGEITYPLFPTATKLKELLNYYGAVNVENQGGGLGAFQLFAFLILVVCMIAGLMLINDKLEGFLCDLCLAMAAVGTGAMMGFSPTIYVSKLRIYSTLNICIMLVAAHVYAAHREMIVTEKSKAAVRCGMMVFILIGYIELIGNVLTFAV